MNEKTRHFAAAGSLLASAFAVYGTTLSFQLVWDDLLILKALQVPPGVGVLRHLMSTPVLPDTGFYRPLVLSSLKADALLAPIFPFSFHFTNVLLHGLVSALFYLFAVSMGLSAFAAFLAALLFAATPLHVESVAFVSGRSDLWAALFLLVAVLAWQRGRTSTVIPIRAVLVSSCAFLLAVLSKETAVVLPPVLLIWGALDRKSDGANRHASQLPWLLGWSLALGGAVALRFGVAHLGFPKGVESSPGEMVRLWTVYGRLLAFPWPLRTYFTIDNLPVGAANSLLALVLPAVALGAWFIRNGRVGVKSLVWIMAFLLPVAGLVRPGGAVLAARYAYIPSLGVALLAAFSVDALAFRRRFRILAGATIALLAAVMAAVVWKEVGPWRSNETLYEAMYRDAPAVAFVNYNLANVRRSSGRLSEAEALYKRALQLNPYYTDASFNLALTLAAQDRPAEAETLWRSLLLQLPNDAQVHGNFGDLLFRQGRWTESESCFRRAAELAPDAPRAHFMLGLSLEKLGRRGEAARAYRSALRLQPDFDLARKHLLGLELDPAESR